jgi:P-type Ca2+ transporter type 2C
VLALAGAHGRDLPERPADAERNLTLYGLVAMADAARPEAAEAVAACAAAGIRPVMITGDNPATARAVARAVGIGDDRRILTCTELAAGGAAGLAGHVADVGVYARTSPDHKLAIVEPWQARGDVVAMTGRWRERRPRPAPRRHRRGDGRHRQRGVEGSR